MRASPQAVYIATVSANKLQAFWVMLDMLYFNAYELILTNKDVFSPHKTIFKSMENERKNY